MTGSCNGKTTEHTNNPAPQAELRPATLHDAEFLLACIHALAEQEVHPEPVAVTLDDLQRDLFSAKPAAHACIIELAGQRVGFCVYYMTWSTITGHPGLHVDDIYLVPEAQGRGIGRQIFRALASLALQCNCRRMEWWSLRWNADAKAFYARLGAEVREELHVHRLNVHGLQRLLDET